MIYFVTAREIGRVKIGYSVNPAARFSKIQTDSPVELRLERVCDGGEADEASLHSQFAEFRMAGEWFHLSPEIEAYMATLPRQPEKQRSLAQIIIAATGCSRAYVSQMLSDRWSQRISIPIAISVYRHSGDLIGPLEGAEDHEIDTLEKFCGRFSPANKGAVA